MSSLDDSPTECPLCTEEFDITDKNLKPCKCGYQVCLWCLNRLMETSNGDARCPNCRRPYDQKNFDFKPLDANEIKAEKSKQKSKKKSHKSRKVLANVRVIQRNLVYVVGLTLNVAKEEFLGSKENFAKYGKISKLVVNKTNLHRAASQGREPTVSAYITFERPEDATRAIQAVDSTWIDGKMLRASFGTTKYCAYFLRGIQCTNPECMYLHEFGHDDDTFTKDDIVLRNGLPTPVNGNMEPYTVLKDPSNVEKHIWNYPRSNYPPTARNGYSNDMDAFWDTSETEGGDYEGYDGDYYDDDIQEDDIYEEEEEESKPKVAIATANNNSLESILPSTACWGNQNTNTSNTALPASLGKATFPSLSQVVKAKKQKKKKSKPKKSSSQSSKKSDQRSPTTIIHEPEFDMDGKESDNIEEALESSSDNNTPEIERINESEQESLQTVNKSQNEIKDANPISSLKLLNEESTPLISNLEQNAPLAPEIPLTMGLFSRPVDQQPSVSSGNTSLLQQQTPAFSDYFLHQYTPGSQIGSGIEQNNVGRMEDRNHQQHRQQVPSLWSLSPEDPHLTQSRFASYPDEDINQSRFANPYPQTHHDMQETLRSLLPNVKVNFNFGFDQQQQQSHIQPSQSHHTSHPSQQPLQHNSLSQSMWGNNHHNNLNIHNNFVQNNHNAQMQNHYGGGYGFPDYNQYTWGSNYGASNSFFQ